MLRRIFQAKLNFIFAGVFLIDKLKSQRILFLFEKISRDKKYSMPSFFVAPAAAAGAATEAPAAKEEKKKEEPEEESDDDMGFGKLKLHFI